MLTRFGEQKLPLSTAILSNIVLGLLLWNFALRAVLLIGRLAAGAPP